MDIELNANSVSIQTGSYGKITVELINVDKSDILDLFDEEEAVSHFDKDEILSQIGEEYCINYFGLQI